MVRLGSVLFGFVLGSVRFRFLLGPARFGPVSGSVRFGFLRFGFVSIRFRCRHFHHGGVFDFVLFLSHRHNRRMKRMMNVGGMAMDRRCQVESERSPHRVEGASNRLSNASMMM